MASDYRYDVGNRLVEVEQGVQRRTFDYDQRGFLLSETHAEIEGSIDYGRYDARGHAGRRTEPGNVVVDTTRDAAGRVTRVMVDGKTLKEYAYDGAVGSGLGKLWKAKRHNRVRFPGETRAKNRVVEETYSYEGLDGRVSARRTSGGPWDVEQTFTWEPLGGLAALGYPQCTALCAGAPSQERSVVYGRSEGRIVGVSEATPGTDWIASISFHPNGLWAVRRHGNGVDDIRELDPDFMQRPASLRTEGASPASADWSSGTFSWDGSGNIVAMGSDSFAYDEVHRLLKSSQSGRPYAYTYDRYGNLTSVTAFGATRLIPAQEATNRLGPASSFVYDARGNLKSWSTLGECLVYDGLDMIQEVRSSCASSTSERAFLYTADDERVVTVENSGFELAFRDLGGLLLRRFVSDSEAESWSIDLDNIWLEGRLVGIVDWTGSEVHVHVDHLGSPRLHTDSSGAAIARHAYTPFGEEFSDPGQNAVPMKFTGHERDLSSTAVVADLDYMHARFYSPWWKRFTSLDPVGGTPAKPQTWNGYTYTLNQPINYRGRRRRLPRGLSSGADRGAGPGGRLQCQGGARYRQGDPGAG